MNCPLQTPRSPPRAPAFTLRVPWEPQRARPGLPTPCTVPEWDAPMRGRGACTHTTITAMLRTGDQLHYWLAGRDPGRLQGGSDTNLIAKRKSNLLLQPEAKIPENINPLKSDHHGQMQMATCLGLRVLKGTRSTKSSMPLSLSLSLFILFALFTRPDRTKRLLLPSIFTAVTSRRQPSAVV